MRRLVVLAATVLLFASLVPEDASAQRGRGIGMGGARVGGIGMGGARVGAIGRPMGGIGRVGIGAPGRWAGVGWRGGPGLVGRPVARAALGGYPGWGVRRAAWGGYPGWGVRRAAWWGGYPGWRVRRAAWWGAPLAFGIGVGALAYGSCYRWDPYYGYYVNVCYAPSYASYYGYY
jgi:hypothetical protein